MSSKYLLDRFKGDILDIPEDWEFEGSPGEVQKLYEEILFEVKQYHGDIGKDFVVLHDKTVYQVLVAIRQIFEIKTSQGTVIGDLCDISKDD